MTGTTALPLSLSEQLDAMLLGWLERRAARSRPDRPDRRATAAVTVAESALPELERFCARWMMSLQRPARGRLALVEGPARAVEGFAALVATSRR
ncbi:MAG TPA: hypothetical protein VFM58_12410 [Solirubrobacteraceae bacterium]|nr:hypothetical protein [Solirubrobacteraceae bacterium]